jgi:NADH-quinone oxidoreductase subunit N
MFGLAGLPPTAGFIAKVSLFEAAIGAQLAWLVIVGALATVVAAVWSFRVVLACLGEGDGATRTPPSIATAVAIITAGAVLVIGAFPGPLRDAVQTARF